MFDQELMLGVCRGARYVLRDVDYKAACERASAYRRKGNVAVVEAENDGHCPTGLYRVMVAW